MRRERQQERERRERQEREEQAEAARLEAERQQQAAADARVAAVRKELADITAKKEAAERERRRLERIAAAAAAMPDQDEHAVECCVCLDDAFQRSEGVTCAELHFQCDGCFEHYVRDIATRDDSLARGSDVACPCKPDSCGAECFSDRQIMDHAGDDAYQLLLELRARLHEQAVVAEVTRELEAEMKRREQLSAIERQAADARRHLLDDIMTLKCPKCQAAFVDFDGCFALTCAGAGCGCQFCAWCLKAGKDGRSAHLCAAECGRRNGANGYYGTKELFDTFHDKRKRKAAEEYLLTLADDVRREVMVQCRGELDAMGLRV